MSRLSSPAAIAVFLLGLAINFLPSELMATDSNTEATAPKSDVLVEMTTTEGQMTLRLYGDTPLHQSNFVKLAREGYYDGMLFHRVIQGFMVQTGDPDSRNAKPGQLLGLGGPGYTVDAEIVYPRHFHRRGALAAARQADSINPMRSSSGSQFYIVTGKKFSRPQLDRMEMDLIRSQKQSIVNRLLAANRDTIMALRRSRDMEGLRQLQDSLNDEARKIAADSELGFTSEQVRVYSTEGGAPHLDGQYTVFGCVENGYDVIEHLEKVETDRNSRPLRDVRVLSVKVLER